MGSIHASGSSPPDETDVAARVMSKTSSEKVTTSNPSMQARSEDEYLTPLEAKISATSNAYVTTAANETRETIDSSQAKQVSASDHHFATDTTAERN